MRLLDNFHCSHVHSRRSKVLSMHLANIIPSGFRVLDVGNGDGLLDKLVLDVRPDITINGIDVLTRSRAYIPTDTYDGDVFPYRDGSYDAIILVDVLHHTTNPMIVLREAKRVARSTIIIKDHLADAFFARQTLRFMDHLGNARYGVSLPYNYWSKAQWLNTFNTLGLKVTDWKTKLHLYPFPANWVFDRSLHFITRLDIVERHGS